MQNLTDQIKCYLSDISVAYVTWDSVADLVEGSFVYLHLAIQLTKFNIFRGSIAFAFSNKIEFLFKLLDDRVHRRSVVRILAPALIKNFNQSRIRTFWQHRVSSIVSNIDGSGENIVVFKGSLIGQNFVAHISKHPNI
jgi:hypothetical protein